MAGASSFTTYLDVARAQQSAPAPASAPAKVDLLPTARVLAAIFDGADDLPKLQASTSLDEAQVVAALASLNQAGLVELQERDGVLGARLTPAAQVALT